MDAPSSFQSALEGFIEDIVMSFHTQGGRSAAVVWPQGEASVVPALVAAHGRTGLPAGQVAHVVARKLGELVDRRAGVRYRTVRAGDIDRDQCIKADTFVVMLEGAVEVRLSPLGSGWPAKVGRLRHRLLAGEVLYIPAGFRCSLSGQHTVALLMELVLES